MTAVERSSFVAETAELEEEESTRTLLRKELVALSVTLAACGLITLIQQLGDEDSTLRYRIAWELRRLRKRLRKVNAAAEVAVGLVQIEQYLSREWTRRHHRDHTQ